MNAGVPKQDGIARRTVLRGALAGGLALGAGLARLPGPVAGDRPELVEALASESGLSPGAVRLFLDSLTRLTARGLGAGKPVTLPEFGTLRPVPGGLRQVARQADDHGESSDRPTIRFEAAPALAAELDLVPGDGDTRRTETRATQACERSRPKRRGATCPSGAGGAGGSVIVEAGLVASDSGLSKADAKRALDGFRTVATSGLKKGDRIALVGFGTYSISKRSARTGRNPQTGKESKIPAKKVVRFAPAPEFLARVAALTVET